MPNWRENNVTITARNQNRKLMIIALDNNTLKINDFYNTKIDFRQIIHSQKKRSIFSSINNLERI